MMYDSSGNGPDDTGPDRAPAQPAAPTPECKCAALGAVVLCDACYRSRQPAAPEPSAVIPGCTMCHRPAACLGSYENNTSWGYSCNECCGHGNEDGRCFPLSDVPDHYLALVTANDRLDEQWHEAVERAESAESQLAAVSRELLGWCRVVRDRTSALETARALLGRWHAGFNDLGAEYPDEETRSWLSSNPAPSPGAGGTT